MKVRQVKLLQLFILWQHWDFSQLLLSWWKYWCSSICLLLYFGEGTSRENLIGVMCVCRAVLSLSNVWSLNVLLWEFGGNYKHWGLGKESEVVERLEWETLVLCSHRKKKWREEHIKWVVGEQLRDFIEVGGGRAELGGPKELWSCSFIC